MPITGFTPEDFLKYLQKQEGFTDHIYIDAGQQAIGYGHKLTADELSSGKYKNGISQLDANTLLLKDMGKAVNDTKSYIDKTFPGVWNKFSSHAKYLLTDMQFNTKKGVKGFHDLIQGLIANDTNVIKANYTRQSEGKPLTQRNQATLETFINPLTSTIEANQDKFPQDTIKPTLNTPVKLVTDTTQTTTKPTLPIGRMAKPRTEITQGRQPQKLSFGGNLAKTLIGTGEIAAGAIGEFFTAGGATAGAIPLMAAGASTVADGVEGFHNDHVANKEQMSNLPPTKAGVRLFLNGGNLSPLNNSTAQVQANNPNQQDSVNLPQFNAKVDNGETVDMNKGRVFSDKLGFAELHKPIAKAIGKIEKSGKTDSITQATKARLQLQETNLFNAQEKFKQMKGIDDNAQPVKKMAYGGGFNPYTGMPDTSNTGMADFTQPYQGYISPSQNIGMQDWIKNPTLYPNYLKQQLQNNPQIAQTVYDGVSAKILKDKQVNSPSPDKMSTYYPELSTVNSSTTNYQDPKLAIKQNLKEQSLWNLSLDKVNVNNSVNPNTMLNDTPIDYPPLNNTSSNISNNQPLLNNFPYYLKGSGIPLEKNMAGGSSGDGQKLPNIGAGITTALEFAPAIYNTMEGLFGKAGKEKPIYANTSGALNTMAGRTYNVNPQLAANRVAFSTALSNARTANPNTGSYMNLGQSAAINKYAADANAYATKQNVDNQYKGEFANMQFQDAANRQAAEMQARQMTLANSVTKQNMLAQGLTNTSDIILNKANTQQQMNMDAYKTSLLPMLFPDVTTQNAPQLYSWLTANGYTTDNKGVYKNGKLVNTNAVYNLFKSI